QVRRFVPAEVNEEMFKQAFPNRDIKTIEEFRQAITEELEKIYTEAEKNKFYFNLKEYILNKVNPKIPESFLKRYLAQTKENITPESIEKDWAELKKMYQWQLIVDKISRERNIKVEKEDLLAIAMIDVERSLRYYGIGSIPEETLKRLAQSKLEKEEDVENFYWRALEHKTLEILEQIIEKEEIVVSVDQF
ncbi:MAG TPA: hypothetical protein PK990_10280, partial [Salinivirgaceae bacterium]|nr:hypothetical protein [Salinivirgaceae bacterium]